MLSAVTPTVARVQLRDLATTGAVVGRLSAWATAGALVGTFATGFVIVPLLPTDVAVVVLGAVLLALGFAVARYGAALRGRRRRARSWAAPRWRPARRATPRPSTTARASRTTPVARADAC